MKNLKVRETEDRLKYFFSKTEEYFQLPSNVEVSPYHFVYLDYKSRDHDTKYGTSKFAMFTGFELDQISDVVGEQVHICYVSTLRDGIQVQLYIVEEEI